MIASYRQTCRAYPNGGGAYTVARANLGESAGLAAASALLVDYVLTVAVSVVAGVAAITSAFPELSRHAVSLSVGFVVLLTVMNLRGVKESGKAFAVPTYGFLLGIYVMFAVAAYRLLSGEHLQAPTAATADLPEHVICGPCGGAVGDAGIRLRLYRSDRRRSDQQRRARLPEAESEERRRHPGHHGLLLDHHVHRHHGARAHP